MKRGEIKIRGVSGLFRHEFYSLALWPVFRQSGSHNDKRKVVSSDRWFRQFLPGVSESE